MSNETVLTGLAHPTDVYSDATSAALVAKVVIVPLIYSENLPADTTVKYVRKDGSLTSSTTAVSEAATYTTSSQFSTSGIAITAIKDVCSSFVTVEAAKFGRADQATMARKQGEALARRLDNEIAALFAGFSTGVTSSSVCTVADVMEAAYTVRKNMKGNVSNLLTAVLSFKSVYNLRKEQLVSAASAYTIESNLNLLGAVGPRPASLAANGLVGLLPGVEVYEFGGTWSTGSGDDTQAVFDRGSALAGMYDQSVSTMIVPVANGTVSYGTEYASYVFHGAAEWNDYAGCMLKSDT